VEESIGRWTGSAGEGGVSVALTWPIELGGKRTKRVDLAQADLLAAEAEVADRERRLAAEVREAFAAAQASLRELEITSELNAIDLQTTKFVESRVQEGDAAPLELSLLRADAERLRSRRALIQGRLEAAILRLKILSGIPAGDILRLKEDINAITLVGVPPLEDAIKDAIATRPDLRLARLNEDVAAAGYRLARAQAKPDLSLSARFSTDGAIFDDTPVGPLIDHDKFLTFGASISLPFRNRNQGAREEAQAEILQARARREFIESQVRAEVSSAYARYEAARAAVAIYETGVIERSAENVKAVRGAYEIGAFRITDLLMEQRRSVDFQIEYTETLAERYRARSALDAAIGVPVR
jgi:cobalt-zinc-cadmium efflux system outer membrane protein